MSVRRIRIGIVHPAPPRSRTGNRVTALRWATLLRQLGQRVFVERRWSGRDCDVLVALHAAKTLDSMRAFCAAHPGAPLIVAGTGTDLYDSAASDAVPPGFALATRIVVLQAQALAALPAEVRGRARVIHQSVCLPAGLERRPDPETFDVAVLASLRAVKDPLLPAAACADLPAGSRVRVRHAGAALEAELEERARAWSERDPRYEYLGELGHGAALELIARCRALVLPSRNEGGANVLSEALALGQPILATRVPGNVGLLGPQHPGLFAPGDASALGRLLLRAERVPAFLEQLAQCSRDLAPLVAPARELECWRALLAEVCPS